MKLGERAKHIVGHPLTAAYIQGPLFVTAIIIGIVSFDREVADRIVAWHVLAYVLYHFFFLIAGIDRLIEGRWLLTRWANQLLLLASPVAVFYGYYAARIPRYSFALAIAALAAGLPVLGVVGRRFWLGWMLVFAATYTATSISIYATMGEGSLPGRAIFLVSCFVFFIWLMRTSEHVRTLNDRVSRLLVNSRRGTRDLNAANAQLKEKNKLMLRELDVARRVQQSMVPTLKSPHPRVFISSHYTPLETVGGDFFDAINADGDRITLVVADVSGHGVSAALVASMARGTFRQHAGPGRMPGDILELMNRDLNELIGDSTHYVTACVCCIDTERSRLSFSLAGHPPPYHCRRGQASELRAAGGFFLGMREDVHFETQELDLVSGDRLLLYTDGLAETRSVDGCYYAEKRLAKAVQAGAELDGQRFVQQIVQDLDAFRGEAEVSDDVTLLCVDFGGGPAL
ncbi:MAG: PP2C family protein-serine/threonine phosphatase [Spirochaetales bacterium]|nr:PP2C family protein-serine/threonine phosphatase [Leptospiraceae bacterium]MCP5483138.1 PP2C family protein-serine/threonine phosphatase [Spirochaetales bacterium]MCP5484578.1 PP2C family protein-serine/threonine phosphatase [Spirochaetales bacterium]